MFCTNCGNKSGINDKHCTKCGNDLVNVRTEETSRIDQKAVSSNRWWHRLGMVIYIFLNVLLIPVAVAVWEESSRDSVRNAFGSGYHYEDTYGLAFWYSFLTIVIWLLVLRLIKAAVQYVVAGRKFHFKDLLYF